MTRSRAEAEYAMEETEKVLEELKLKLANDKTQLASFERGFPFLGVWFEKDTYSYNWEQKRIKVKGRDLRILYRHIPEPYEF